MANSRKEKGREVEEEEKRKRGGRCEHRKVNWWKKCKELIISVSLMGMKKSQKKEGRQKRVKDAPKQGKFWGSLESGSFSQMRVTELSKCERSNKRTTERTKTVMRMQQEVQVKEYRSTEETSLRWRAATRGRSLTSKHFILVAPCRTPCRI